MTTGGVGAPLTLATIHEGIHLCNIAPLATAGTILKSHIRPTTFTTFPPTIPITAVYEMITSVLKIPVAVGQKFILLKTHDILLRVENGPSATLHLPTPQLTPGPPMTKGPLSTCNVKADRIGGKRGRAGIGTMGAATVGEQTTRGSPDMEVTPVASITTGSVRNIKMTVLNETRRTGRGSLLRRGNHRRGAVGVGKASAIRTTDVIRIETGVVGVAKKVATTTSKDGISDRTIVT
jgi:hypothetical protein